MKEITKMSRLNGQLEKAFRIINHDWFNDELPEAIITAVPTSKAYAHYTPWDAWETKTGAKREINIITAYLNRPLENIIASLIHEMVHMYNDCVTHEQDTSRGGTYHNKVFKRVAEEHGLVIEKDAKYGWTITTPSDELFLWVCEHDELKEIQMNRNTSSATFTGGHSNNKGTDKTKGKNPNSHSIKYVCPCCGNSVRATKIVRIACLDCNEEMLAQ